MFMGKKLKIIDSNILLRPLRVLWILPFYSKVSVGAAMIGNPLCYCVDPEVHAENI